MDYAKSIYDTVIAEGYTATLANLIVAQAEHESANFSSNVFKTTNNAFGYKCFSGSTLQISCGTGAPEGGNYARYGSVQDSTKEVLAWLRRKQGEGKFQIADLTTPETYATALKKAGYFGDSISNYIAGLKTYLTKIGSLFTSDPVAAANIGAGISFIFVAGLAYGSWLMSRAFMKGKE